MTSQMFRLGRDIAAAVALAIVLGLAVHAAEAPTRESTQDYQGIFLRLQKLTPENAARLNEKAKAEYEKGLTWVDKFNYPLAMQYFSKAVDEQPDNVLLRYVAAQMSVYLGNTRRGKQAVEYFETALTHLNAINESSQINQRERERVAKQLDLIGKRKESVNQRDLMRNLYGRELAKQYAAYIYKKDEKDTTNKTPEQEALERSGVTMQSPGAGAGAGETEMKQKGPDIVSFYRRTPRVGTLRRGTDTGTRIGPSSAQATTEENASPSISPVPSGGGLITPAK